MNELVCHSVLNFSQCFVFFQPVFMILFTCVAMSHSRLQTTTMKSL